MFKYDVTLSFAGEERTYVETIAKSLKKQNIKVFYDNFETNNLWGKDLYQYLQTIYRDQAQYCVIFFSKNYLTKSWTRHELKQAQARAFADNTEYILPILMDVKLEDIPGMNTTTGYIDYNNFSQEQIANLIIDKINYQKTDILKVKFNNTTVPILYDDIIYIESQSPLIYITTSNDNVLKMYSKLSSIALLLPNEFIRIHNSFIVNKKYVKIIYPQCILLTNEHILPISRSYKQNVKSI